MISDPFINNRTRNEGIEDLALNKENIDIPTLVEYLKSPGIVSDIARNNVIKEAEIKKYLTSNFPLSHNLNTTKNKNKYLK